MASHSADRLTAAMAPIDAAMFASEQRWGVARLERLVGTATLESYRRGWTAYRAAIESNDADAVEAIAPKMIAALAYMAREAEAAGHAPLSVERWEAPLEGDAEGRVLVIVRTQAEAHAIARDKSDKREMVVYSLAEIARLVGRIEIINAIKLSFPGSEVKGPVIVAGEPAISGVQMAECEVSDWATNDPLAPILHGHAA